MTVPGSDASLGLHQSARGGLIKITQTERAGVPGGACPNDEENSGRPDTPVLGNFQILAVCLLLVLLVVQLGFELSQAVLNDL